MKKTALSVNRAIAIIGLFVSLLLYVPINANTKPLFRSSLKQGMTFLSQNKPDSAITHFVKAYSEGLSRDSLFYFWSEALLQKEVLDSALAAHFMVSNTHSGRFKIDLLQQRSAIYNKLGWHKDAAQALDTMRALPEYRHALFIPDVEIGLTAGFNRGRSVTDTGNPWGVANIDSIRVIDNHFSGIADFRSTWGIIRGQRTFSFGISGTASRRSYTINAGSQPADSIDLTSSLFASFSGRRFSSTYNFILNRRMDDSLFIGNSIEGGIVGAGQWSPMVWIGGFANLNTAATFTNSRLWLFASVLQRFKNRVSANYHCFFNVSFDKILKYEFPLDTMHILYAEDAQRQYPIFYTDASYASVIDTSLIRVITGALRNDIIASARDTFIVVTLQQPNSSIIINPKATFNLKWIIPVSIGISWKLNYFWEPYVWDQINMNAHYFVYSRSDGRYYLITADNELRITRGTNGGLAIDPSVNPGEAVTRHIGIRIDNAAIADISLRLHSGKTADINLQTSFSKNWSTLAGTAPVAIPEWSISAALEWRLKLLNSIKRF